MSLAQNTLSPNNPNSSPTPSKKLEKKLVFLLLLFLLVLVLIWLIYSFSRNKNQVELAVGGQRQNFQTPADPSLEKTPSSGDSSSRDPSPRDKIVSKLGQLLFLGSKNQNPANSNTAPRPSPSIIPLSPGPGVYNISQGDHTGPTIRQVIFDPLDVKEGQQLTITLKIQTDTPRSKH